VRGEGGGGGFVAKDGGREGIQKGRRNSREERPMIYTPKRQTMSKTKNKHENVCILR
jgi:hypothetical protein